MDPIVASGGAMPDIADPAVMFLAIALTGLLKRYVPAAAFAKLKPWVPFIVLLLAVGIRAAYDATAGEGVTWETVGRGVAAAGVAVLSHAQVRSLLKTQLAPKAAAPPS